MCDKNTGAVLGAIGGAALAYATGGASLGLTAGTAAAAGGVAGAVAGDTLIDKPAQALELQKQANAQNKTASEAALALQTQANQQAKDAATKTATAAEQAANRANARTPDLMGLSSQNTLDAKGGVGSTMLTGPQGIDPKALLLGRTTLLGG